MHTIAADEDKVWNLQESLTIPLSRNSKIALALTQSAALSGRLIVEKKKYENVDPELEGIRVIAKDEKGRQYTTLTDEKGSFKFYLPVARYEVFIQPNASALGGDLHKDVTVAKGKNAELKFILEDRRRKIEVKQF